MLPKRKRKIKCISKSNKYEGVILFIDNVESRKKVGTRPKYGNVLRFKTKEQN